MDCKKGIFWTDGSLPSRFFDFLCYNSMRCSLCGTRWWKVRSSVWLPESYSKSLKANHSRPKTSVVVLDVVLVCAYWKHLILLGLYRNLLISLEWNREIFGKHVRNGAAGFVLSFNLSFAHGFHFADIFAAVFRSRSISCRQQELIGRILLPELRPQEFLTERKHRLESVLMCRRSLL